MNTRLLTVVSVAAAAIAAISIPSGFAANAAQQGGANATPAAAASLRTQLYVWRNVRIVAGGFVNGILFHPTDKNVRYVKTDMGGAYRWDARAAAWVPLTDWASQKDWNLRGVESIGMDPSDPARVYLALGTYTGNGVDNGAMLRSSDYGRTWQRTDMPFKMGGNENGRSAGERLAVDPNDGRILFFGSRNDGMWRSADRGATWTKVTTFPITGRTNGIGIAFVLFDRSSGAKGAPTSTLYAGVSAPEVSLYRSTDGGVTWSPVPGEPSGMLAHQGALAADGTLYLTYGNAPGPNGMTAGAVWKYDTRRNVWTDISPIAGGGGGGFAGLSIGGAHEPQLVMVSTLDHWGPSDDIFRSTDSGAHWVGVQEKAVRDPSLSPYLFWGKPTPRFGWWIGALAIDPFDTSHVMYGTGATIWETRDAADAESARPTHWSVGANGIEETAVIDLISPPAGAHLLSGLGDIGGFRHDDLNVSPPMGMYENPNSNNVDCLDFAEHAPTVIVRVGRGGERARGALSTDGGTTWAPFPTEPTTGGRRGSASIAISADGSTLVWASGGAASVSHDRGATWTPCTGYPMRARVISDRVNPSLFYAFSTADGKIYASTDGGLTFAARAGDAGGPGDNDARLRAVPDHTGDLWLIDNKGLYHSTDGGATFQKLTSTDVASAVGFGKAAPGRDYVALYLIGTVGDVAGFFRSDDAGATWVRINDDQHQYGLVGPIIGDPRIYGRAYLGTNGRGILYADPATSTASSR
jgi:photosystem II stability/assembly factor-like uncharacterized protein